MRDDREERWRHCKALIAQSLSAEDAGAWLTHLRLERLDAGRVVLAGVPNGFFRKRIQAQFRPLILQALAESFPELAGDATPALELRLGEPAAANGAGPEVAAATPPNGHAAAQPAEEVAVTADGLNPRCTFATFQSAPGNRLALRFAQDVAAAPGRRYNPLVLVGATGLGKSHLLQAIAHTLRATHPDWQVLYRSGEDFKNEVLEAITARRTKQLRDLYRAADALLLDELGYLLISPKSQEELLHTFDRLHGAGRQVVLSIDRYPAALPGLQDALRSRLEMGLLAELEPPDLEARLALVHARAADHAVHFPEAVSRLLAERVTRNLRQLEGAVVRLAAYAGLHGEHITPEFAERVAAPFFDTLPGGRHPGVTPEAVLQTVTERFGVTPKALRGRSRTPNLVTARRVAIHLLRSMGGLSYSEVGAVLGNRSHSTIIHGHQTLQEELARNEALQRTVLQLGQQLGGPAAAGR